ncbi:MAG: response regulator transcription factor, partial [Psychroserpens sp.]|nr:response regulator transcription factor [Psychroserpens sp.]
IKVSITDDHFVVLKGIESLLQDEDWIDIISIQENAEHTLENFTKHLPDVLLLDINLPDLNGIELTKKLLGTYPDLKIIALTNHEDLSFVKRIISNGACGYLLKNAHKEEILGAIKSVMNGEKYFQSKLQKKLLSQSLGQFENSALQPKLTKREKEVLKGIAAELTTKEISEQLFISPKTVESHRMSLMSKLGAKNSVGIVRIAMEKQLL